MKLNIALIASGAAALAIGSTAALAQANRIAYPTEDNPVLLIEQRGTAEVRAGSDHTYSLYVRNVSDQPLHDVKIHQTLPSSFQVENESMPSESEEMQPQPRMRMQRQQQEEQRAEMQQRRQGRQQNMREQQEEQRAEMQQRRQGRQQNMREQQEESPVERERGDQSQRQNPQDQFPIAEREGDVWIEEPRGQQRQMRQQQGEQAEPRRMQNQQRQQQEQRQARQMQNQQRQQQQARQMQNQRRQQQAAAEQPSMTNRVWTIGMLAPREEVQIRVSGVPTQVGEMDSCVYATYEKALCTTLSVIKPELSLIREWVDEEGRVQDRFLICDPVFVRYTIMNEGVGTTPPAVITEELPKGLVAAEGGQNINIEAGELEAGESETFTVALKARTVGQVSSRAVARAGELSSRSNAEPIYLEEAEIDVSVNGRGNQYIGRDVEYEITVQNLSEEVPAENTRVRIPGIEQRMRFANTNREIPNTVDVFTIGTIPPGESRSFSIVFSAEDEGEVATRVEAMARCAENASTTISTEFRGIPALQVVVVDQQDPVPVGEQTVYEITVLNEGSATDANIRLSGELPAGLEFVSGTGDSNVQGEGQNVNFGPIQNLEPGERASWLVTVRGVKAGKGDFNVNLKSNAGSSTSGEPTTVY